MKTYYLQIILSVFQEQEKPPKCGEILGLHIGIWFFGSCAKAQGDSVHIKATTTLPTAAPFSNAPDVPTLPEIYPFCFCLQKKTHRIL